MDKESTTFGVSPERIAEIFQIGSDINEADEKVDLDQKKAELLSNRLEDTLPFHTSVVGMFREELGPLRNTLAELTSESIGKLLLDSQTDITIITKIKDYGKKLSKSSNSEVEYETANTIYHAAIARCMVSHGRKITKFSCEDLRHYFNILRKKNWIPTELRELFKQASQYCRDKMQDGI